MKKIIFVILLSVYSFSNIYAQFGIRAGVNVSNEVHSFQQIKTDFKSDNLTAFQIGIVEQIPFGNTGIALETGLLYTQKGNFFEYVESEVSQHKYNELNYVEIPLNVRLTLPADAVFSIYGTAGLYAAYMFSGRSINESTNESESLTFTRTADRFDYGLAAGIGAQLFKKIQLGATWTWGLKDTKIYSLDDLKTSQNRVFSVNLTYLF